MKKFNTLGLFVMGIAMASFMFSCGLKKKAENAMEDLEEAVEEVVEEVAANTLTQEEIDDGWVLLFDGKTTEGWRGYNMEAFPDTGWYVENGTLHCISSGKGEAGLGGDIIYDKKFKNFKLKLEWKIGEGGNSGIFYLAQEVPGWQIWKTAPEMQILDNERHIDAEAGKDGNHKAGSLYDLIPAVPQNTKPAGEWNSVEIWVYDGSVFHRQNGEQVVEYHLWTDDWNNMIKDSKFPGFNPDWADVANEGYIGLQDHGDDVWFRNIKIKEM
jgi:hypothetical protein